MKKLLMILSVVALIAIGATGAFATGTFIPLTDLPGSFFGGTLYLSYDGQAMGGAWNDYFYWTEADGFMTIDTGGLSTSGGTISGDGSTLCFTRPNSDGLNAAAYWTPAGGFVFMDEMPGGAPCGSDLSSGYALNFDGSIGVGLGWISCDAVAFKWTQGVGTVNLGSSGNSSRATDISDDGTVTVGFDEHPTMGFRRAAFWTDDVSGPQLLADPDLPGEVYAVSSDGTKMTGVINNEAFYWDNVVGVVPIGTLPGDEPYGSTGLSISDDGKVVGFSGDPFFSSVTAIIWTVDEGLQTLSDYFAGHNVVGADGLTLTRAMSISGDGNTITGSYVEEGGFLNLAFMARLDNSVSTEDHGQTQPQDTPQPATALLGASPNPFNPMTNVKFSLAQPQNVRLTVFDMHGHKVTELANELFDAGEHALLWPGTDTTGRAVPSGTYMLQMVTDTAVRASKMMLVR